MALFSILFIATIAFVSAVEQSDPLETAALTILNGVQKDIAKSGKAEGESLMRGVAKGDASKRQRITEEIGTEGVTFVAIKAGTKQVNATLLYGAGVGVVVNVREDGLEAVAPTENEVEQLLEPLRQKHVKALENDDAADDTVTVVIKHGSKDELKVRDGKRTVRVKDGVGFIVAAKTKVSKSG